MRLSYYFVLIFSMQLGLYLIGYPSPIMTLFANQGGNPLGASPVDMLTLIAGQIASASGLATLIPIIAGALVALALGFSAMFIIPLAILVAISNLYVFPTQFLFMSGCDPTIATCTPPFFILPIIMILNLMMLLAYVEFVRGAS